jgi:PAS domain S-box-containing protein
MTDSIQALEDRLKSVTDKERIDLLIDLSLMNFKVSPAKARSHAEEALGLSVSNGSKLLEAKALNALGKACLGQLNHNEALKHLHSALSLYEKLDSKQGITNVLENIGQVYYSSGEQKDALEYLNRGLEIAERSEALDFMIQGYHSLSELYEKEEDFEKSLEYHRRMSELEKKLFNLEKSKAIAEIDAKYQTEKAEQEAEISIHKEELVLKNRELEKLLKEKNDFLGRMTEYISDGVMIDDQNGKILYSNDRFLKIFGISRNDLLKMDPFKCIAPEWREKVMDYHNRRLTGEDVPDRFECEGIKKGGGRIWLEVGVSVVERDGVPQGTQSLVRDITNRRILEAQLLQSQKLDAVGRLAGGIAHDFNNLLTVIKGHTDFILLDIPETHPMRPDAEGILKAADRASLLTQQLLAFSRQQILQPRILNLGRIVSGLQRMLSRLLSEDIQLVTSFSQDEGCVFADESQIEQVIVNLVINARDSMKSGGKLTIEVINVDIDENSLVINPDLHPGRYMQLSISDTGCGMNADTQARIFEPFYSTKLSENGSGLGLAMVYGIIKQSDGVIEVSSEPAVGTTFMVYLPRVEGEHIYDEEQTAKSTESSKGENILLVEDDEALRSIVERYLSQEGYEVMSAGSAEEALKIFEGISNKLQFLLTDVVLPGINGVILASMLKENGFNGSILYMTGYIKNEIMPDDMKKGDKDLLEKPFSLTALRQKIRDLLDAR